MARRATIIGRCRDAYGDWWDVREDRPTTHGWPVQLGWPHGHPRGLGGGGQRVIPSSDIVDYLTRTRPRDVQLPIGRTAVKRLRRLIGLDWYDERRQWWEERAVDLVTLTVPEFAARHGVTESRASQVHTAVYGRRIRQPGWWREPAPRDLLIGELPRAYVADTLEISVGAVGRLRWVLRSESARQEE